MIFTHKHNLRTFIVVTTLLVLALGCFYAFGKKPDEVKGAKLPPLVTLVTSETHDLPIRFSAQGHLVALNQIEIRPQITGIIRSVDFHEGDSIQAGQLLFTLDATDANAQYKHAQAQSAQLFLLAKNSGFKSNSGICGCWNK